MPYILAWVIAAALAALFSQVPEFTQQYLQRLGGTVDQLDRTVRHFVEDAARSGYDQVTALRTMEQNPERLVRDQAQRMTENISRRDKLRDHQTAIREGGPIARYAAFVSNFDRELAKRTYEDFQPAIPLTLDGILFALVGLVLGHSCVLFLFSPGLSRKRA